MCVILCTRGLQKTPAYWLLENGNSVADGHLDNQQDQDEKTDETSDISSLCLYCLKDFIYFLQVFINYTLSFNNLSFKPEF